ncbi:MAG: hypothetical protein IJ195_02330 [Lachnospiraceae bacterium]|nr:hypothetical protein [Lachnospiraceae bacterium]
MLTAKPTEKLTGVTIEGSYDDLYELVESIYRMSGLEDDYADLYWSVKNRLLGVCYDLRHAYMGDREIIVSDNEEWETMKGIRNFPKKQVRYAVNILFPEAVFVAISVQEMFVFSRRYYGNHKTAHDGGTKPYTCRYSEYLKDKANIEMLSGAILSALADVITEDELEMIMKPLDRGYSDCFMKYAVQYLDKCNIEYLKTPIEKRKDKLRNITKRLIKQPDAYRNMKRGLEYAALKYGCSIHELHDPDLEYPEEVEW